MKKLLILLLFSFGLKAQTYLQLKQIQPAAGSTSVLVTNSVGLLTYTPGFPVSKWANDVPYLTSANTSTLYLPLTYTNNPTWSGIVTQNSTAATSTVSGTSWFNGINSAAGGWNFYSDDPTNVSFGLTLANSFNKFSIYQDHGANNWLVSNAGTNISLSTDGGGSPAYSAASNGHAWAVATQTSGSTTPFRWSTSNNTNQTASTEESTFIFAPTSIQYATGALARHRTFRIGQQTIKFVGGSTSTSASHLYIESAPVAGTNATLTNSSGLQIGGETGTVSLGAGTINGYAISAFAPTGATNNYAARFMQGNVGIGTAAPTATLHVVGTAIVSSSLTAGATTVTTLNATGASALTGVTNTGTFSSSGASTLTGITNTSLNCSSGSTLTGIQNNGTMNTTGNSSLTGITNTGTLSCSGAATITGNSQLTGSVNIGAGTFGTSLLHQIRISKGTGTFDIGEYSAGRGAAWLNQNTPSATNWALSSDASGNLFVNAPTGGAVDLTINGSIKHSFGNGTAYINGSLKIGGNTTPNSELEVVGDFSVATTSTLTGNVRMNGHLIGGSTAPTFTVSTGAGAGATATLSTNSTDIAGTVSITTAAAPAASSVIITLTFNGAYAVAPNVTFSAGNAATALLITSIYRTRTTTTFSFNSGTTPLVTATLYEIGYQITQ